MLKLTSAINNLHRLSSFPGQKIGKRINLCMLPVVDTMEQDKQSTNVNTQVTSGQLEKMKEFIVIPDSFKGIVVDSTKQTHDYDEHDFLKLVNHSLPKWKEDGIRGVWFKIHLSHTKLIPLLVKAGFVFHHAQTEFVSMVKWLPETYNTIPPYPHTFIGIGAIVVNEKNEILVIKQKYHQVRIIWKFPGGYIEKGEDLAEAAIREVKEETNVDTEFVSLVALRQAHTVQFDCSDLYFICHLKLLSTSPEIKHCDIELHSCKWMKIDEYLSHEDSSEFCRFVVKSFIENKKNGLSIETHRVPSIYKGLFNDIFRIKRKDS
ncbi:Uncharacterised protein g11239 [Pycnogonum litorale]